jgi:hypothetical protein
MKTKKPVGQSKPLSAPIAKKAPEIFDRRDIKILIDPVVRASLEAEIRLLEHNDEGEIIKNISTEGFKLVRLDQLKKIVILLSRVILGE